MLDVQVLVHSEVLAPIFGADPVEGGQPGELGAGDRGGLSFQCPHHSGGVALRGKVVAALHQVRGGRVGGC